MLKRIRLIALIALLAMFIPLSMDMYLPALPQMALFFRTSEMAVNSTLFVFYFFMAAGMLALGPLSDKVGRKRVLAPCALAYSVFSVLCVFSAEVWQLVAFRAVQGLAVGALVALSTAMIKDGFEGRQRETILAISQAMSLVAPIVAPVIGAFILQFSQWQTEFLVLAAFGILVLALALPQEETLPESQRLQTGVFASFSRLGIIAHDKVFMWLMVATSIAPMGYMAYVSASSYIYQYQFGLSETQYGLFYSVNAVVTVIASLAYIRLSARFNSHRLMKAILVAILTSGVLVATVGQLSPFAFLVCFIPNAFMCTVLKPFSTSLLLRQREGDAGSASAMLNFSQTIFSCLGLVLGSIAWPNMVLGLGGIMTASALAAAIGWAFPPRTPLPKEETPV